MATTATDGFSGSMRDEIPKESPPRFRDGLAGSPQQNTDTHRVRIHYPFHPLVGQSFWIRESRRGSPPTLTLEAENGETFNVATWMTRESAADIRLEDNPRLSVRTLLDLVVLIRKGLESLGSQGDILLSDQTKENVHVSQATPAVVVSRSTETATTPTGRHSRKKRRHHGADAPATDPQGAPGKGGA